MAKKLLIFPIIAFWLTSCGPSFSPPPAPTATWTLIPLPTKTLTPTLTPFPTETQTPVPTEKVALPILTVHSRDEFEEMVKSGLIKCQGTENGGQSAIMRFADEAKAAGVLPNSKYMLGSGIPSASDPSQCLFLMTFSDEKTTIIYRDSETGKFVKIIIVE